jgi:beta-ureidopropionase / N-carbamoyl-L-amino-acid hydrolase
MQNDSAVSAPRVNGPRLWSRLMAMAQIGATAHGGCNRQALTDGDRQGRELFMGWAKAAGCAVRVDAVGNIFARRPGRNDALPVVMTGSHLDTQPTGGKFDGVYGVLAGLEVMESLNDHSIVTSHPLEVGVWCNEEGCRFPIAMMGSAVWSGRLPLAAAHALTDRAGISVGQELARLGVGLESPLSRQPVKAALEVHIEQGPLLEQQRKTIGIVTGVQHMSRYEVAVLGQEAHAGPTPMDKRRDPIRVLADVLPALYAAAARRGPQARLTIGFIDTLPGSPNTVPGRMRFTVDLRHPDGAQYRSLCKEVHDLVQAALERHALEGEIRRVWEAPGVEFDAACIGAVRAASAALECTAMEMISGAGHDSCNLAAVVPTAMIFVPCAGGLSHNEAESALPSDLEAGANVLLHAMLLLAHDKENKDAKRLQ